MIFLFQGIVLVGIFVPFIIGVFIQINIRTTPTVPWFILPGTLTVFILYKKSFKWFSHHSLHEQPRSIFRQSMITLLLGAVVTSFILFIEYLGHKNLLLSGKLLLPGDPYTASKNVQTAITLFLLAAAGPIEEIAVRSAIQFRLQTILGRRLIAEITADGLFVIMHFERITDKVEVAAVIAIALVCGRAARYTQNVRMPMLIHSMCNVGVSIVVIGMRN